MHVQNGAISIGLSEVLTILANTLIFAVTPGTKVSRNFNNRMITFPKISFNISLEFSKLKLHPW